MNVVADSHGEGALLSLIIFFALTDIVLGNLSWKTLNELSFVRVVNDQVKVTLLVVKGDGFGRWER
mgnify:CR=1 FL=1|jgi:hypothetical protein|tara:strand:+ start:41 stop:238 length:198 start_codon:yes stop_codon:yes gene_type:complete